MVVVDRVRSLETHGEVEMFRIMFEIQVESVYLATCSLLNIDVTDLLMM